MRLSVVIPAHDAALFIKPTLASLARQTQAVHEVIVVDDGSTDETVRVATETGRSMGLPLTLLSQDNKGVSAARNRGLEAATGDFVLFLDADDLVEPALVQSLAVLGDSDLIRADVIAWRFQHVDGDGVPMSTFDKCWTESLPASSVGHEVLGRILIDGIQCVWTGSAAYRAAFLRAHSLRFTEGCATGEDTEFIWKALALAGQVSWLDRTLSYYVAREGSTTTLPRASRVDGAAAYQRAADFMAVQPRPELQELARVAQRLVVLRYMLALALLAQAGQLSTATFSEIEQRNPGLTAGVRRRIGLRALASDPPTVSQLLLLISPRACAWYLRMAARRSARAQGLSDAQGRGA